MYGGRDRPNRMGSHSPRLTFIVLAKSPTCQHLTTNQLLGDELTTLYWF